MVLIVLNGIFNWLPSERTKWGTSDNWCTTRQSWVSEILQKWAVILNAWNGDSKNVILQVFCFVEIAVMYNRAKLPRCTCTTADLFTPGFCCWPVHMTRKLILMVKQCSDKKAHDCSGFFFLVILGKSAEVTTWHWSREMENRVWVLINTLLRCMFKSVAPIIN